MSEPLAGQVVALIAAGSDRDRAIAIACAEAGADLALGTTARDAEFVVASIANEVWAIGREQLTAALDARDPAAVTAFAEQVWDRFGRCDALVAAHDAPSAIAADEVSVEEWEAALDANLTAPFLAAQAFGRLLERSGRGTVVFLHASSEGGNPGYRAAKAGLVGLAGALQEAWRERDVRAVVVAPEAAVVIAALAGKPVPP